MPARRLAFDVLGAVLFHARALDDALDDALRTAALAPRDRAFARLLVATALRRRGQIEAAFAGPLGRPLASQTPPVRAILMLGAAQLMFLDTPPHAAVDTAVALAKRVAKPGQPGFINALLRRLGRQARALATVDDAPRLNTPDWLWQAWTRSFGAETAHAIAAQHLLEPPLDLTPRGDAAAVAARLGARLLPTGTIRLTGGGVVSELPGYAVGEWWAQDVAAALPAKLLGDVSGRRVIDLGAAPGGKTAQLAAAGGRVLAIDRSAARMRWLRENLTRLGLEAGIVIADGRIWRPAEPADAVLVDAPCSATGTIRRHPDIPWSKTAADVANLAALQAEMLANAVAMVKPGGRLIYCVCSLQAEEGVERVEAALGAGLPIRRLPIRPDEVGGIDGLVTPRGDVQTLPCHLAEADGMDGFFIARLERVA